MTSENKTVSETFESLLGKVLAVCAERDQLFQLNQQLQQKVKELESKEQGLKVAIDNLRSQLSTAQQKLAEAEAREFELFDHASRLISTLAYHDEGIKDRPWLSPLFAALEIALETTSRKHPSPHATSRPAPILEALEKIATVMPQLRDKSATSFNRHQNSLITNRSNETWQ